MSVAVVDGGGANVGSVLAALARLGADVRLTREPDAIRAASHVILPGVGAAAPAMARLREDGLDRLLARLAQPVLGICLGMQLLYEGSEEGDVACLGAFPGRVAAMKPAPGTRIPHMGWNHIETWRESPLLDGLGPDSYAYFVHGYAAPVGPETVARARHGAPFSAIVSRGNFHGVQFHPERSAAVGATLLRNFLALG